MLVYALDGCCIMIFVTTCLILFYLIFIYLFHAAFHRSSGKFDIIFIKFLYKSELS